MHEADSERVMDGSAINNLNFEKKRQSITVKYTKRQDHTENPRS